LSSLREFNRLRIVDFLRTNGTASRAELSRRTGLSRSTVSTLVSDLQRRGLVVARAGEFAGEGQPGRPAALLELDPSAGAAVGVDFNHDNVRVAVSDLSRSVLAELSANHDVDHDAEGALTLAADMIERVVADAELERERLLGVGIALAGPIDHDNGALHPSDVLPGWSGVIAILETITSFARMPLRTTWFYTRLRRASESRLRPRAHRPRPMGSSIRCRSKPGAP